MNPFTSPPIKAPTPSASYTTLEFLTAYFFYAEFISIRGVLIKNRNILDKFYYILNILEYLFVC